MRALFYSTLLILPTLVTAQDKWLVSDMCKESGRRAVEITLTFDPLEGTTTVEQRYLQCNKNRMLEPNTGVIKQFLGFNVGGVVNTEQESRQCMYDPNVKLGEDMNSILAAIKKNGRPIAEAGLGGALIYAGGGTALVGSGAGPGAPVAWIAGGAIAGVGGVILLGDAAYQFFSKEGVLREQFENHLKEQSLNFKKYRQSCSPTCVRQKVVAVIFSETTSNNVSFYDMAQHQMTDILKDFHVLADNEKCGQRVDTSREVANEKGTNLNAAQQGKIMSAGDR